MKKKIELLITSPLADLLKEFKPELHLICKKEYDANKVSASEFIGALNAVLFYESHGTWKAYQTAIDLKVRTCPYCNRTYITTLGSDEMKFVRGDFDHFLLKSEYPYLRLSFYNLVPCCVICNRNAKHEKETTLKANIYPFIEGFGEETIFTYVPENYDELAGYGQPAIDFFFLGNSSHVRKSKGNIEVFRLKEQYSIHFREVNQLIKKKRIFSESYINDLLLSYPGLHNSTKEAYSLLFGKELELSEDENMPLSKLTRDLAQELGFAIK